MRKFKLRIFKWGEIILYISIALGGVVLILIPGIVFLNTIGGILVGGVSTSCLLSYFLTRSLQEKIGVSLFMIIKRGIIGIYENREEMKAAIAKDKGIDAYNPGDFFAHPKNKSIKMIGINLNDFADLADEHRNEIIKWFNPHCKYEFLILNPEGDFIWKRMTDESDEGKDRPEEEIKKEQGKIEMVISKLNEVKKQGYNITIKTYDIYPMVSMIIRNENELYVGPYLFQASGTSTPWIRIEKKDGIFDKYLEHFDKIWKSSRTQEIEKD